MASYKDGQSYHKIASTTIVDIDVSAAALVIASPRISNSGFMEAKDFVDYVDTYQYPSAGNTGWYAPDFEFYRKTRVNYVIQPDDNTTFVTSNVLKKSTKAEIGDRPPGAGGYVYHIRDNGDVEIFRNLTLEDYITCSWNDYKDTTHDFSVTETAYNDDGTSYQKNISNWERVNMTEMDRIALNVLVPDAYTLSPSWDPTDPPYYWTTERKSYAGGRKEYGVYNANHMYYSYLNRYSWLEGSGATDRGVIAVRAAANHFPGPHTNYFATFNRALDHNGETPANKQTFNFPTIDSITKIRWDAVTTTRTKDVGSSYGGNNSWLYIVPNKKIDVINNASITDGESDSLSLTFEYNDVAHSDDGVSDGYQWNAHVDIGLLEKPTITPDSIDEVPEYEGDDSITLKPDTGWNLMSTGPVPLKNIQRIVYSDDDGNSGTLVKDVDFQTVDVYPVVAYYRDGQINNNAGPLIDPNDGNYDPDFDSPVYGTEALYTALHTDYLFYFPAYYGTMILAKNTEGKAYLPEWNFNGMGLASPYEGFHVKVETPFELKFEGLPNIVQLNSGSGVTTYTVQETIILKPGWQFFRFPGLTNINVVLALTSILEHVIIVKNNAGKAYLPYWDFNGIGDFKVGEAYQIKMEDTLPQYELVF